ncbi:class I adenylate-forming enzyme family protein [Jannaschia seohaensis]|uniref:Acyl-CoA synthetase (AMP-forming)/AMP-acid ligase II n=1 Tax=Jannaschia seohaensis TaxID=475081 RepID=A0A2Y9C8S2_9RHOB|nr:class I adenylate-forming enzyme family protein [Jannaschia seohaensis]PWJ14379.1 acyl-CoA synthetase (AMP-forming)/AMP-acid ligase II [Jannaschia seohaensis]SSA50083.1 Acyl-CoA synthetase (AMP-forming)/AMP-acid ligase II [Jannaschia seohaensis]
MSFNLAAYVLSPGRDRPDHPALIVPGRARLRHADLLRAVAARAGGLRKRGLAPGARILLRLGNEPDFPITFLAASAAGLVPVPTSAQLTAPEIGALAERIDAALAVAGPGIALPEGVPAVDAMALDDRPLPMEDWADGSPDRLGYIVFTSGSGGAPKAVAHAHRAVSARVSMHAGWYGLRPSDRVMHAGAFNWTYTLGTGLLDPWTVGATAVIPAPGTEAQALPGLVAAEGATIFAAAPGIYRRMLRADWPATPGLRHGLSAGERLPPALRDLWRSRTGTDLHEAYGLSECSTFVSGSPARPAPEGTTGHIQPGRSVRVEGDRLIVGADDPGLMLGYWEDGAPEPVPPEGFDTGDRVTQRADGAIVHEGRRDDLLNPGGHRVSPQEVEAALADLPVEEIAVGCVTLESGATVLAAYYVGAPLDEAVASAHAAARLARYKQPRLWLRRAALPRNANGKLIRRDLA